MRHLTLATILLSFLLAGCNDRDRAPDVDPADGWRPAPDTRVMRLRDVREWLKMIDAAGMEDYARLGREMLERGRIEIVAPPRLDGRFNAWTNLYPPPEIWLSPLLWERYPEPVDRATILLHELIHVHSGEQTHRGPWWSAQDDFRAYWRDR